MDPGQSVTFNSEQAETWPQAYQAGLAAAPTPPAAPEIQHRPPREWYAAKIRETMDDDFEIGPPAALPEERTYSYRDMIAYGRLCWAVSRATAPSETEPLPKVGTAEEMDATRAALAPPPAAPAATLRAALEAAHAWISSSPHGDNCYVSAHYPGDPGAGCNCGKESVETIIEEAIEAADTMTAPPGMEHERA